jgi:hypothetical protein
MNPFELAVSPDGKSVYVTNFIGNSVSQYDVGAGGALTAKTPATVPAGMTPAGVAVSPDGKSVYVANRGGNVSQYDVGAGGLLAAKTPTAVPAGGGAEGIVVVPDQGPSASFTAAPAPAGSVSRFDGSSSGDADGTIARYDWDFGDGTTLPNGGPAPTHAYAAAGTYTARLTVTDDGGCSSTFVFTGQTAFCTASAAAITTRTITVPAAPPAPTPIVTKFVLLGAVTPSPTAVSFSLACQAAPGALCRGLARLTTLELLAGRRIVALNARHKKQKRYSRRVLIGANGFSLAAGQTRKVVMPLNATGRKLLARFRRIPATIQISLLNTNPPTVLTTMTTIKAKKKKHKRGH